MISKKIVFLNVLLQVYFVDSANILCVFPSASISHQVVFQPIWRELSLRGHKVFVITPNPLNDETLTNLTEINISSFYDQKKTASTKFLEKDFLQKPDFATVFIKDVVLSHVLAKTTKNLYSHPNVQEFLKQDFKFDVLVAEWLFPLNAAFAAKYKTPIVGLNSLGAPVVAMDTIGNPSHPVYAPDHNLPLSRDMRFRERIMSAMYAVFVRIHYHQFVLPKIDKIARKYFGNDIPYIGDIEKNISVLLLNRNPVFHRIMPTVPSVIELGQINVNYSNEKLSLDLENFLNNSKNGALYFSLGSNFPNTYLTEDQRDIFLKTFAQLPFNVVWKWEDGELEGKPKNIFVQKWFPQYQLLGHKNIKLFITNGGLQSMEDTIRNHVPIIGIPHHSDQITNVDTAIKYGMGIAIDMEELTVEKLNNSIYEIINNSSYKQNAIRLEKLMNDQPINGLDKAIWWIEYVIRNKGATNLRSPYLDVPWYQYLLLDVLILLLFVLTSLALFIVMIIKLLLFGCKRASRLIKIKKE